MSEFLPEVHAGLKSGSVLLYIKKQSSKENNKYISNFVLVESYHWKNYAKPRDRYPKAAAS